MREFLAAALQVISVLSLDGVLDGAGHRVVGTEDGALHELNLTGHATLEAAAAANAAARLLALSPCLCGARLAPRIRRGCSVRCAVLGGRIVATRSRVDIRASVRNGIRGISRSWRVRGIRLGQAVCGLRALIVAVDAVVVIEGARAGAGGIRVQQRTADFILIGAVSIIVWMLLMLVEDRGENFSMAAYWGVRVAVGVSPGSLVGHDVQVSGARQAGGQVSDGGG